MSGYGMLRGSALRRRRVHEDLASVEQLPLFSVFDEGTTDETIRYGREKTGVLDFADAWSGQFGSDFSTRFWTASRRCLEGESSWQVDYLCDFFSEMIKWRVATSKGSFLGPGLQIGGGLQGLCWSAKKPLGAGCTPYSGTVGSRRAVLNEHFKPLTRITHLFFSFPKWPRHEFRTSCTLRTPRTMARARASAASPDARVEWASSGSTGSI